MSPSISKWTRRGLLGFPVVLGVVLLIAGAISERPWVSIAGVAVWVALGLIMVVVVRRQIHALGNHQAEVLEAVRAVRESQRQLALKADHGLKVASEELVALRTGHAEMRDRHTQLSSGHQASLEAVAAAVADLDRKIGECSGGFASCTGRFEDLQILVLRGFRESHADAQQIKGRMDEAKFEGRG